MAAADLPPLLTLALAGALYERRIATLQRKRVIVPLIRRLLVWTAILVTAAATASPLHKAGEELLAAHMVQHVLLGDLAPLALAFGLTRPVLRPLLAVASAHTLRHLAHPLVAFPLWAVTLVAWHVPALYDAAVESAALHSLEHGAFFLTGMLMWISIADTVPAPPWFTSRAKLVAVVVARTVGMVLGNILFWASSPLYPRYDGAHGLNALEDQQAAAALMMGEGTLITVAFVAALFLRALGESERKQSLVEQGVSERRAARAVRYRRPDREQSGIQRTDPRLSRACESSIVSSPQFRQ
jgi:cytochrome c oxidase assembly factor CtaG